jgi:L-fucose mutarotase
VVFLNLAPGLVTVTDVLEAMLPIVPIEGALLMGSDESTPEAHDAIRSSLPTDVPVDVLPRHEFYAATRTPTLGLVVATGDSRPFANVLLTIGVVSSSAVRR